MKVSKILRHGSRYYKIVDEEALYPSVTTILKIVSQPTLESWKRNKEFKVLKDHLHETLTLQPLTSELVDLAIDKAKKSSSIIDPSAEFGVESHTLIEDILKSDNYNIECADHLKSVKTSFIRWLNREKDLHDLEVVSLEETLVSRKYQYAGTADAIARVTIKGEKRLVVIDWKTSNQIRNHYALQIAAYSKLYEENYNLKIFAGLVIRFSKVDSEYEVRTVYNLDRMFEKFMHYKNVWELEQELDIFDCSRISSVNKQ